MPSAPLHHRRSIRLATYNYRQPGAYFVTICTYQRELIFGDSQIVRELELAWRSIGRYARARPDYFVVMPNHIHGIIWLTGATPVGAQHTPKSGHLSANKHRELETIREYILANPRKWAEDPNNPNNYA